MLISPPFLPRRGADQSDADWLNIAMSNVASASLPGWGNTEIAGSYPVSLEMGWHGGSHLVAPVTNNVGLPVRAIADGRVIYLRQPTELNDNSGHPLNYGAPEGGRCWTSNGVVLIRHETDIGASAEGQAVSVVFYSLYMHLEGIAQGVRLNRSIYRKDEVGTAGYIYGQPHRIHFEIFCDDDNLQRLVGRNSGNLPTGQNGRNSVVFGELYFHLPAGTVIYAQKPPANQITPTASAVHTTTEELIVGLRYAQGDGAAGQRGDAMVTTYHLDGTQEGNPLVEHDAEYTLYRAANDIAAAYPANARPAPSAAYELLRFGRIIGTDALTPADVPHWRHLRYPGGHGWANLNAVNVRKCSDADFPHWKGWCFIDESADQDSRCDSTILRGWFDKNKDGIVDAVEPFEGTREQAIRQKLEHSICKFPTEWKASTLDKRWSWLKDAKQHSFEPLNEDDFKEFKAHAEALCFWEDIPAQELALANNPWRFHPKRFIRMFRRCGWLSGNEFAQCFPRKLRHLENTLFVPHSVGWQDANARANRWKLAFNRATRKYGISASKYRLIHFFAHVIPETGYLRLVKEGGGEGKSYSPYYGRGLIQLTHLDNYKKYGKFKAFTAETTPLQYQNLGWNPDALIARNNTDYNAENCADSAGFYVAQRENMLAHLDAGVEQENAIVASKDVNGYVAIENLNGLDARLQSVMYLINIILDKPFPSISEPLGFTWRRNSRQEPAIGPTGQPEMIGNPPHVKNKFYPVVHSLNINFEHQKP